jgi:lysophospholipase L1-like esterase
MVNESPSVALFLFALMLAPACARETPRPSEGPLAIRYAALGDSFTIGTGSSPEQAFPSRLADRYRKAGFAVTLQNLGVNGYTTADVLEREIPALASFRPTFVTFAAGANDWLRGSDPEQYRTRVRAILTAIAEAGVARSRIVTLPQPDWSRSPTARSFGDPASIYVGIVRYNAILKEESLAAHAQFVDLFPLMKTEAEAHKVAPDGLHPSSEAHDEWAAELSLRVSP